MAEAKGAPYMTSIKIRIAHSLAKGERELQVRAHQAHARKLPSLTSNKNIKDTGIKLTENNNAGYFARGPDDATPCP
jgi:hypothetical protein